MLSWSSVKIRRESWDCDGVPLPTCFRYPLHRFWSSSPRLLLFPSSKLRRPCPTTGRLLTGNCGASSSMRSMHSSMNLRTPGPASASFNTSSLRASAPPTQTARFTGSILFSFFRSATNARSGNKCRSMRTLLQAGIPEAVSSPTRSSRHVSNCAFFSSCDIILVTVDGDGRGAASVIIAG